MPPFAETNKLTGKPVKAANSPMRLSLQYGCSNRSIKINQISEGDYFNAVLAMMRLDRLGHYELTHVKALVFYGAKCLGVAEQAINDLLSLEFGITDIVRMERKDYNQVVDFLRDLQVSGRLSERQAD